MPATLINTGTFALFDAARDCVVFWKSKHDELNVRAAILSACEASCWIDDTNQLEWRRIES